MKLSDGEKLILVMLSDIYQHLKIDGDIDPKFVKTSIFDDQTWGLAWQYTGLFPGHDDTPPVVKETCDIFDMYRVLDSSFKKLSAPDQKRVRDAADPFSEFIEFQGFDFNNDPHASVASYLVKHLERYTEINPDLNSHSITTLQTYRAMLKNFKPMIDPFPHGGLSADQIIKVLDVKGAFR